MTTHGANCVPTSLGQGVNLQQGWSQFGVANDSVEPVFGLGQSFFVVCPVDAEPGFNNDSDWEVRVNAAYLENNQINIFGGPLSPRPDINCTWIEYDGGTGVNADGIEYSQALTPIEDNGSASADYPRTEDSFTTFNADSQIFATAADTIVVLCALPPQTRITTIEVLAF